MAFKDVLNDVIERPSKCKVAQLLDKLQETDQDEARDALNPDSGYSGASLAKAFAQLTGESLSASAVNNHRKGVCPCRSQMR